MLLITKNGYNLRSLRSFTKCLRSMTTIPAQELLSYVILDSQTLTLSAKCLIDYWIFGHRSIHGPWSSLLIMEGNVG